MRAHHTVVPYLIFRSAVCTLCMNMPPSTFSSQQVVFVASCKGGKKETELYWRWVEEVKPPLPRDFRHKFHMAAILLKVRRALLAQLLVSDLKKGRNSRTLPAVTSRRHPGRLQRGIYCPGCGRNGVHNMKAHGSAT